MIFKNAGIAGKRLPGLHPNCNFDTIYYYMNKSYGEFMMANNWHAEDFTQVLSILESSADGISEEESRRRLLIDGANELEVFKRDGIFILFLRQFHNILIYVLLFSGVITLYLGHLVDAGVILGVVVLNAIVGFIQEGKAEKSIEAIRSMLAPNASVIRAGRNLIIPAKDLVKGDLVLIKSGDKVPADLRLCEIKNLQIQEAILTGESLAVEKNSESVSVDASLGDRLGMAYSGTTIVYGKGTGVVVATGANTEIGKIGTLLKKIQPITTPLLKQMEVFGRWLTLGIVVLALFSFLFGVLVWHGSPGQMFMAAVGLAVAAIPEGLPPILTIILAIGVARMAKRNAIIRQLPAVETMGAITVICTDKTGTLTRNEQTVKSIVTSQNGYEVEEDGIASFSLDKKDVALEDHGDLLSSINAAILCNDGKFTKDSKDRLHIHGNPIDKAILELGGKSKIDLYLLQNNFPRTDVILYASEHKLMATMHHSHGGQAFVYVKGAPEYVLARCSHEKSNGENKSLNLDYWHKQIEILACQGYRVIAIASKDVPADKQTLLFDDINA